MDYGQCVKYLQDNLRPFGYDIIGVDPPSAGPAVRVLFTGYSETFDVPSVELHIEIRLGHYTCIGTGQHNVEHELNVEALRLWRILEKLGNVTPDCVRRDWIGEPCPQVTIAVTMAEATG